MGVQDEGEHRLDVAHHELSFARTATPRAARNWQSNTLPASVTQILTADSLHTFPERAKPPSVYLSFDTLIGKSRQWSSMPNV